MKNKNIFLPALLLFLGCMIACQDAEIPIYESGSYISFKPDKNNTKLAYSFLGTPSDVLKDTITVEVQLIGRVVDFDREVAVVVADSSTAKAGIDFEIIHPIFLKKNEIRSNVQVVLNRTEALRTTSKTVWLAIADSEALLKAERKNDQFETYKIEFAEDMSALQEPAWWASRFSQFVYSKMRHLQYINEVGSSVDPTEAVPGMQQGDSYYYVLYKLQTATKAYNDTHEEPLSDENGPISWEL
jgi:hypothetical protein